MSYEMIEYPIKHFNCRCVITPLTHTALEILVKEKEKAADALLGEFSKAYHSGKYYDKDSGRLPA